MHVCEVTAGLEPDVVIVGGAACTITTAMHPLFFSFAVATFHCQCHCCSNITYEYVRVFECVCAILGAGTPSLLAPLLPTSSIKNWPLNRLEENIPSYFLRFIRRFMRGLLLKWSRWVSPFCINHEKRCCTLPVLSLSTVWKFFCRFFVGTADGSKFPSPLAAKNSIHILSFRFHFSRHILIGQEKHCSKNLWNFAFQLELVNLTSFNMLGIKKFKIKKKNFKVYPCFDSKNMRERCSWVTRLTDTRYSSKYLLISKLHMSGASS